MRRTRAAVLALGLALLGTTTAAEAVLNTPDAIYYGRVFASGQPAADGVVVSARSGNVEIDSFELGSSGAASGFYVLSIPVAQSTDAGETPSAGSVFSGTALRLFVDLRAAGEVTVAAGRITQRDLTGGLLLCAGGSANGSVCMNDGDCPGGGVCVVAQAVCDGGADDGMRCQCIGGTCNAQPACMQNSAMGTCAGGALGGDCCEPSMNCEGGACAGSARLCLSGGRKGFPCLRDGHCPGGTCGTTGKVCLEGERVEYACVDDADCAGAQCGPRAITPGPTSTVTRTPSGGPVDTTPTPTLTPPPGCPGDCDGSDDVSISELITLVNIALGFRPVSVCPSGDLNRDQLIAINELIGAVTRALNGCGG